MLITALSTILSNRSGPALSADCTALACETAPTRIDPFGALDAQTRRSMHQLLSRIFVKSGSTVLRLAQVQVDAYPSAGP